MRLAIVDLECTSLKSDLGFLLCGGIKELGKPAKVIGFPEAGFAGNRLDIDKNVAAMIRDEMCKFDGWITWNGLLFDIPFLDDRLTLCNETKRKRRFARGLDIMWHAAKGKSCFASRRLDWVARLLGCPMKKTDLDMNTWKEAEAEVLSRFKIGRKSYDYIAKHCKMDLAVTEWVYNKLKDRIQSISKR